MHTMHPKAQPKTSTLAIVALVLTFVCMPVGLILGIIALVQINNSNGELTGKGLAIASIVLSVISVMITGVLMAVAIPNFIRYQLRAKTSEAKAMLGAIRQAQMSYHSTEGGFIRVTPTPDAVPGTLKSPWPVRECNPGCSSDSPAACDSFECIGFQPDGNIYYAYACEVSSDRQNFTCAALGDLDGDGIPGMFVLGTGDTTLVAPIPDYNGNAPDCTGAPAGIVFDCTPGVF